MCRSGKRRRYSAQSEKLKAISALLVIRNRLLIPLGGGRYKEPECCGNAEIQPADQFYLDVRSTMCRLLEEHLGVAAYNLLWMARS